jgi:hypothetical protein
MNSYKIFLYLFLCIFSSCKGQNINRLQELDAIPMQLTQVFKPHDPLFWKDVIQFRGISNNDTTNVRVIATIFHNNLCGITIYPHEYQLSTFEEKPLPPSEDGLALSYDETMSLLFKVAKVCKFNYKVSGFSHIRMDLSCMGDFSVDFSESFETFLKQYPNKDKYEALRYALQHHRVLGDLQLIFSGHRVEYEEFPVFFFPEKTDYRKYCSYNKVERPHDVDSVHTGLFVEYQLSQK